MKKITLKISAFLLLSMCMLQVQAQACPEIYLEEGSYLISTCGSTPELYLTIDGTTGDLVWAEEIGSNNPTQVWTIQDHVTPSGTGYVQITADVTPGPGPFTMIVDQSTIATDETGAIDQNDKEFRISVRTGLPVADETAADYGFDQFQRRRTAGFGGPGNDALFVKPLGASGGSRYGVIPTAAGEDVLFDGGGIDGLRFVFIEALPLSDEEFDTSSVFISNPVKDELSIEGLNQNINKISVYDLLGKQVITSSLEADTSSTNLDVSTLTSGIYIVKLEGENGATFSKKIIKE
ncbi:T9SS type A sorting domain-containing protein [Winogradskyella litoriviva]|uniref:T9SS type A sorting domain-containing protein n=1 Tax=Winogradskyella litoriviva TaxID=1220182 RepID=A0ABX2E444_9FLAO|nr:T9SS type A sorting domain-containing protein [Winogradskyella litoriviva]NRD23049.1 T9SS type A sorting domain-containing protein [Winogradskyella litoriviva]